MITRVTKFKSDGLSGIQLYRAPTFAAAARIFANRLGRNLFGRTGRMFALTRIYPRREPKQAAQYRAVVGTKRGPRTELEFWVTLDTP